MSETIFRVEKNAENPYVMIDKNVFEDTSLSFKAKGILGYLLSRPNDWTLIIADIQKRSTDGKDSVKNGIDELIERGYIVKTEQPRQAGKFATCDYVVYEKPINTSANRCGKTVAAKPSRLNRHGKTATTNKDITKKDLTNKDLTDTGEKQQQQKKPKKVKPKLEKPSELNQQLWDDLISLRKQKNQPLTYSAWHDAKYNLAQLQLGVSQGHTMNDMVGVWLLRGWQGFKFEWYLNHVAKENQSQNTQGNHNAINQPTFGKSAAELYAEKLTNQLAEQHQSEFAPVAPTGVGYDYQ